MDLSRLFNVVLNVLVRRLVNFGIDKGLHLARRTTRAKGANAPGDAVVADTQSRDARALAKKARQAAKITRRLGR